MGAGKGKGKWREANRRRQLQTARDPGVMPTLPPPLWRDGRRCRSLLSAPNGSLSALYPPDIASQPPVTAFATALETPFRPVCPSSASLVRGCRISVRCVTPSTKVLSRVHCVALWVSYRPRFLELVTLSLRCSEQRR